MSRSEGVIWCDRCGVEITWSPMVRVVRQPCGENETALQKGKLSQPVRFYICDYCCLDCFQGQACHCGERMEIEDERRNNQDSLTTSILY
jgi:hypothetical protein